MQRVGVAFESLLLEAILRPALAGNAAFGDYGVTALAQSISARDTHGFGALMAARLDERVR
ncbi:MAG TPA: hypothetical protein VNF68_04810 [Candidatus Baltobacteraceae bacterium]|nr:hypothetical protein [Candidatus Baltobacteraceae bacterium]